MRDVVALSVLFEHVSPDPLMLPGHYLPLQIADALINPMEVVLFLVFLVWLGQGIARRNIDFRRGRMFGTMMLFLVALLGGLVHGAAGGGDFHIGLWEARFLFYIIICYVLATNTIRTWKHVSVITGLVLVCNTLFAIEGAIRHLVFAIKGDDAYEHVDVIFLGSLLVLTLAQNIFGGPKWQRIFGLIASPIAAYTLLASERRAGYISIVLALVACCMVLFIAKRKAFLLIAGTLLVVGTVYLPLFWNNVGLLGQPARAVKSLIEPDQRDAASNLYRDIEKINVVAGIDESPLLGLGFGHEFPFVAPLPDLSFWLFWHYEPHHNILWVWLKVGGIGFVIFWALMGGAIARSAYLTVKLTDPRARSVALLTLGVIVATLVFCYVDLGLVSGRVTVLLGTLIGIISVLEQIRPESSAPHPKAWLANTGGR